MPQILQHIPAKPTLHGGMASALLNAVEIPNDSALINISCDAGSALLSSGFLGFLAIRPFLSSRCNRPDPWARPQGSLGFRNFLRKADHTAGLLIRRAMPEKRFLSIWLVNGGADFNRDRQIAEIAGDLQRGSDLLLAYQSFIKLHFHDPKTAAGIDGVYPGQLMDDSPDLLDMVIAI